MTTNIGLDYISDQNITHINKEYDLPCTEVQNLFQFFTNLSAEPLFYQSSPLLLGSASMPALGASKSPTKQMKCRWIRDVHQRLKELKEAVDASSLEMLSMEKVEKLVDFAAHQQRPHTQRKGAALDSFALHVFVLSKKDNEEAFRGWCEVNTFNGLDILVRDLLFPSLLMREYTPKNNNDDNNNQCFLVFRDKKP